MKIYILLKFENLIRRRFYNYSNQKKEKLLRTLIPFKINDNLKILPIFLKFDFDIIDILYNKENYFVKIIKRINTFII